MHVKVQLNAASVYWNFASNTQPVPLGHMDAMVRAANHVWIPITEFHTKRTGKPFLGLTQDQLSADAETKARQKHGDFLYSV
jgi:hypothetical protein